MDFARATRDEWKWWPNREDVTLRVQIAVGVHDAHPLAAPGGAAKRRAPTWREATASGGAVTSKNLVWLLPAANLPAGVEPRAGDRVRDADGTEHTVLEVQVGKFANTFRCTTIALAVVYRLSQRGELLRPTGGRDAAGRPALTAYAPAAAPVRCRVQPQDARPEELHGRLTTPQLFSCVIDTPLGVRPRDVFRVTDPGQPGRPAASVTDYTVVASRNPDRLDQLMELDLELVT